MGRRTLYLNLIERANARFSGDWGAHTWCYITGCKKTDVPLSRAKKEPSKALSHPMSCAWPITSSPWEIKELAMRATLLDPIRSAGLEMAASLRGLLPSKQTSLAQHVNFLHEMGLPYDCRLTKRGKDWNIPYLVWLAYLFAFRFLSFSQNQKACASLPKIFREKGLVGHRLLTTERIVN